MFLHQLKNQEEKYFLKILKSLKIEKIKRNEISFLEIEREKIWVISLRDFLEIETLVNVCQGIMTHLYL